MGKRSEFARMKGDYYVTPNHALTPLLPFLPERTKFAEPCAGNGALVSMLERHGHIGRYAADVEPKHRDIVERDCLAPDGLSEIPHDTDMIITNPPWTRSLLHPMIEKFSDSHPTWLLFDADWMHTKQAASFIRERCRMIVSVGRVKWIEGSSSVGKDNAAWYLFHYKKDTNSVPVFHPRSLSL